MPESFCKIRLESHVSIPLINKTPEFRVTALRRFLQQPKTWEEIPVTGKAVNKFFGAKSHGAYVPVTVVIALVLAFLAAVFLKAKGFGEYEYYAVIALMFLFGWLVPRMVAKYYFLPQKLKKIDLWEREFVMWFTEWMKVEEVHEDLLAHVFDKGSASIKCLARRLLQARVGDAEETYLQLRGRREILDESRYLEEKARDFIRVLGQALHEVHLSEHDEMLARVRRGESFVSTFQLCESKVRALKVEVEGLLFPNGVPQDADPR